MRRLPVLVRRRNKWRTSSRLWGSPGTKQQCLGQTWFRWKGFEVTLNAGHAVKLKDFFGGHPERFGSHYGVDMFWRKMESKSLDWVVRTMLCGNQELSSKWTSLIVEDQALFTSRQQYHRNRMSHGKAHLVQAWVQELINHDEEISIQMNQPDSGGSGFVHIKTTIPKEQNEPWESSFGSSSGQETNWSWWTNCHQNQPAWYWRIRFGSGSDGWGFKTTISEAIRATKDQWNCDTASAANSTAPGTATISKETSTAPPAGEALQRLILYTWWLW